MIVVSYMPATFIWKPHRAVMYVAQNIWNEEDFQETFHSEIDLCFETDCNSANSMCHNIVLWVHISWLVCQNYESRMYYHNHWSVEAYSPLGILCLTKQNMQSHLTLQKPSEWKPQKIYLINWFLIMVISTPDVFQLYSLSWISSIGFAKVNSVF